MSKKIDKLHELAQVALKSTEVCDEWKSRIREALGELEGYSKQLMTIGSWYLSAASGCLITPINDKRCYGYFCKGEDGSEWDWENRKQYFLKEVKGVELVKLIKEYEAVWKNQ